MKEKQLRDDLKNYLGTHGYVCWFAPRVRYFKNQDILNIYDGIAFKGKEVRLIQFTTKGNASAHRIKIKEKKKLYGLTHESYLWLYDGKKREWIREVF